MVCGRDGLCGVVSLCWGERVTHFADTIVGGGGGFVLVCGVAGRGAEVDFILELYARGGQVGVFE